MDASLTKSYFNSAISSSSFVLLLTTIALGLLGTYWKNRRGKTNGFPKIRNFPWLEIPILEGFCTLYQVWKDGLNAPLKWASMHKGSIGVELYFGPLKTILLTDASAVHKILNSSNPGHLSKPVSMYSRIFISWLQTGLIVSEYDLWKKHRRIVARSFTFRALQTSLKIADSHGKNLAKRWIELSRNNKGIVQGKDIYNALNLTLGSNIIEFCVGKGNGFDAKEYVSIAEDFNKIKSVIIYRFLHPELFIAPIWWLHPKRRELNKLVDSLQSFLFQVISWYEKKLQSVPRQPSIEADKDVDSDSGKFEYGEDKCLIESMLYHGASREEVYAEVGTILVAGLETTERAIAFLLLDLALNLDIQGKCREEVDSLFDSKSLNSDFDLDLSMDDLTELKYLERCILESLRLTPTLSGFIRQLNAPIQINENTTIDKGYNVLISPWVIQRDSRYYPNPMKFDPDRFLPENVKMREPGTFIPFSGGPRNCIGYKSGLNQMKVMMTWILRNFEVSSTDKRDDVKLVYEITTKPERHYNIILTRRKFS